MKIDLSIFKQTWFALALLLGVSLTSWSFFNEYNDSRKGFIEACETMGGSPMETMKGERVCAYLPQIDQE